MNEIKTAIENLTVIVNFAYEQGYHELGIDPVQALIDALTASADSAQEQHYDDYAVDCFADLMKEKLRYSREVKGRCGWNDPKQCSVEFLNKLLLDHVEKGDPVDVANLCMMLRHYDAKITMPPQNSDAWMQNPYTKALQKSIKEDYAPKTSSLAAGSSLRLSNLQAWEPKYFKWVDSVGYNQLTTERPHPSRVHGEVEELFSAPQAQQEAGKDAETLSVEQEARANYESSLKWKNAGNPNILSDFSLSWDALHPVDKDAYKSAVVDSRAAMQASPAQPKGCIGCLHGLGVKDGKHTHASGIYAGDCTAQHYCRSDQPCHCDAQQSKEGGSK